MTKETQAWIKELEGNARNGRFKYENGDLLEENDADYDIARVVFTPGYSEITLNGEFTIEQLEVLLSHMKQYAKVKE